MKPNCTKHRLIFLISFLGIGLSGCGQECYTTPLQLAAKYEQCQDLGTAYSPRINQQVKTYVCTTSTGDMFADFVVRDGKLCRTYKHDF